MAVLLPHSYHVHCQSHSEALQINRGQVAVSYPASVRPMKLTARFGHRLKVVRIKIERLDEYIIFARPSIREKRKQIKLIRGHDEVVMLKICLELLSFFLDVEMPYNV